VEVTALVLLVMAIVFIAAFVRSALGFGDAVVAMPLLAAIWGVKTATPFVAFLGPTISIFILARHWAKVDLRAASKLIAASVAGIPVGVYLLARLPETPLRTALGVVIILYGLFGLLRPAARPAKEKPGITYAVGFVAGILGGATNANGPPVVIYGTLREWPPEKFRATLQGYFLPTGLVILLGHGAAGLWTGQVLRFWALTLPALLAGVWLGGKACRNIPGNLFRRLVYVSLVVMGALLILQAAAR
jgi:uncharacterized membrane protein YfcA